MVPAPHFKVQSAPAHRQMASPDAQSSVQPPSRQVTRQVDVPRHFALDPAARESVHVLPPSQVTPESAPAVKVQSLVPAQVPVEPSPRLCVQVLIAVQLVSQSAPQVPVHSVEFAQCEVQLVPQFTLQVLSRWQSNVTLLGNPASSSAPPSAALAPSAQVPPAAQVHWSPVH